VRARAVPALAALALAACGGGDKPPLRLTMHKVSRGTCPVTLPVGREAAPPRLQALAGDDGADRSYGRGGLWVLLPLDRPNAVPVHSGYDVKVAWYLNGSGDLRVVGERLDGVGRVDYDAFEVPGPGPRMQASALTVPAPGCYGIEAEHHGEVIRWVFRASVSSPDSASVRPAAPPS
jgi:hypothetical protein